ncbi:MAG: bis(5'-nucleosyl)-tetraphosphatase (symmetrical) YqeK [Lachnospirales bacterium]
MIYPDRIEVLHWLYSRLKPHRFLHTLGVEQLAVQLAMRHHLSIEMASSAALLHDCAKNMPMEELLKVCDEAGVDLKRNQDYPQLLHAFAAPIVAQKQFGPLPEELLNAIRFHTTGRAHMTPMEKLIFSADYAEPGREPFPGLMEARDLIFQDLNRGTLLILKNTVQYLHAKNQNIHFYTLEALQSLQQEIQSEGRDNAQ